MNYHPKINPRHYTGQYFIGLNPYMFRAGEPARIEGIASIYGRDCFHLQWTDGMQDWSPIVNEDFTGKGGLGVFYDIVKELPHG